MLLYILLNNPNVHLSAPLSGTSPMIFFAKVVYFLCFFADFLNHSLNKTLYTGGMRVSIRRQFPIVLFCQK